MNISAPSAIHAVGSRSLADRPWIKRVGASILLAAAVALSAMPAQSANVSGVAGPKAPVSSSRSLSAPITHPAVLVETALMKKARAGALSWASADGAVNGEALIQRWANSDMEPTQAIHLLSLLVLTQSPTLARTDKAQEVAELSSRTTQDILSVSSRETAAAFLEEKDPSQIAKAGSVLPSVAWNRQFGEVSSWGEVWEYWQQLSVQRDQEAEYFNEEPASAAEVSSAMQALAAAVDEVGLAALQIPLSVVGRPDALKAMTDRLLEANRSLESLTGMQGPVLGLNGRISYMPVSPEGSAYAYRASENFYRIEGTWESVPHEWIHVLDFSLRSSAPTENLGGATLTDQVWKAQQPTYLKSDALSQEWLQLYGTLVNDEGSTTFASDWKRKRSEYLAGQESMIAYAESPSEVVGYAWGSFVQSQQKPGQVFFDKYREVIPAYGFVGPTIEASAALAPQWKKAFDAVNKNWWSSQLAPTQSMRRNLAQAAAQWSASEISAPSTRVLGSP